MCLCYFQRFSLNCLRSINLELRGSYIFDTHYRTLMAAFWIIFATCVFSSTMLKLLDVDKAFAHLKIFSFATFTGKRSSRSLYKTSENLVKDSFGSLICLTSYQLYELIALYKISLNRSLLSRCLGETVFFCNLAAYGYKACKVITDIVLPCASTCYCGNTFT